MDSLSRYQDLKMMIDRYLRASKKAKGALFDEYCRNTAQNGKYAIRKINRLVFTTPRLRNRRDNTYGTDAGEILHKVWQLFEVHAGSD